MLKRALFVFVFLTGCQTAQQKSERLVNERAAQLQHLSSWPSTWCQIETELTEPAKARYEQMFPFETAPELTYAWRSRESTCEITPLVPGETAKSHQAFLETAMCLLMQVHYLNSPFDELNLAGPGVEPVGEYTHIKAGDKPELGIFLPRDSVTVETRTKSRGVLRALYEERQGQLLPKRLQQDRGGTVFVVEDIEYDDTARAGARPMLKSFWIAVGAGTPLRHSKAIVRDCRPL